MPSLIDLTGKEFGYLKVLKRVGVSKFKSVLWECRCKCGNTCIVTTGHLRSGHSKSCSCLSKEVTRQRSLIHGMTGTKFFRVWTSMVERCTNHKHKCFKNYGGRGIKVSQQWRTFSNFKNDMHLLYKEGLDLDRIDNDGDYCKKNCRWVSRKTNCLNKRNTLMLTYNNETKPLMTWCNKFGVNYKTCAARKTSYGWTDPHEILFGRQKKATQ